MPDHGQQRDPDEDDGVEDDLPRGLALSAHDRQHRHLRGRVLFPDQQGERPEVRRRPEEDDQEEEEGGDGQVPGGGGPADERGDGARRAADDDVLGRRPLEPAGVDEDVEEVPDEGEDGGEDVRRARGLHHGGDG